MTVDAFIVNMGIVGELRGVTNEAQGSWFLVG